MSQATTNNTRRWGNRIIVVLIGAVAVPVGATLLYQYPPTEYSFLPCMFNQFTGLHCPGCGTTRACHSLLHGEFAQALAWNPLILLFLPLFAYGGTRTGYSMWTGSRPPGMRIAGWMTTLLVATLLVFWVVRNIPVFPFDLLAPHQL